ncbi:MAG: MBL fold metallo-hydrolase [Thermomicrobiales bacterium]|nr:MBL fold metallo-hydrolase [Thermomicrobiales bacterium]
MIVERIFTPGLAQVAYLVLDETSGEAAVVDPRRDIGAYLMWAREHGARIVAILETHVHADFVSGARELAAATGAPVYAGRLGETEFLHVPLDDGDEIYVGGLTLRALWTPGHTPEHIAYLLIDPAVGSEPAALFSGDVLFAGEIGRPDLLGEAARQHLIEQLHETVTERLAALPDAAIVYPGHTAGSPCGKKIGDAPQTTIGHERSFNYAFNQPNKAAFIRVVMDGMPKPPAYYPTMKRVNKVGPDLWAALPGGEPMTPRDLVRRQRDGALVIDTRSADAFSAAHVPGAIAVELGPSFAIWAGWLTPYDRDVILVLDSSELVDEARTELRRIGIDRVAGWLDGGMAAWLEAGLPVETMATMPVAELAQRMADRDDAVRVLDVRDPSEWAGGSIPGAVQLPVADIVSGAIPPDDGRALAAICGSGYRSVVAASLLQARGVKNVANVPGGTDAWVAAGLPLERLAGDPVPA